ncbi:MAG: hypothetical protein RLZZ385_2023 [Pseudomonadota bacterium]
MLQDIRDNTQGVVAKVIIGLIVAVFALWGVESIIGGFITSPSVAEVNGDEITEQELAISTQNLLNSLGGNIESMDQGLLEQVALNQLVEQLLLRQAAEKQNLQVSENRVDRAILQTQQFQIDGRFDSDLAIRTMASQGYTVPMYRQELRESILLGQLANAYTSSNFVTEAELQQIAALRLQTRDFRFISVPIGTRTLGEAISDSEIQAYYEQNAAQFTEEETVSVRYVMLDKMVLMDEIELEADTVQQQYDRERSSFEGSAERRASHILFEVGPALSQQQALDAAAAAKARLDAGEDFGAVARELSSDTVSAEADGDIGFTDGTVFPQAIEDALLALEVGAVSDPVISEFGVHLVKLTQATESAFPAFEEVSDRIIRELKSAEVEQIYAERLEDLSNMAFESPDLPALAERMGLTLLVSEPFTRSGGSNVFSNPAVIAEAFSEDVLEGGHNSNVVELNDSQAVVMQLEEYKPATLRPLEDVQGEIAVIIRTEMERERAAALGSELLEDLQQGQPIDELLTANELEWFEQNQTTRGSTAVNREIVDAVFALQKPETGPQYHGMSLSNGTYVVVELNAVNPGDLSALPEPEKMAIVESMLDDMARSGFSAYIESLRTEADITTRLNDPDRALPEEIF